MNKALSLWCLAMTLSGALFFWAVPAFATLGGTVDSIQADAKTLSATMGPAANLGSYTIYTLTSTATTLREYVSPSGVVFALAWNGLFQPEVTPLLGSYAGEYQQALQSSPRQPGVRSSFVVKASRVVVERWGHMRNMQGRAYAPDLVPQGVSLDAIR